MKTNFNKLWQSKFEKSPPPALGSDGEDEEFDFNGGGEILVSHRNPLNSGLHLQDAVVFEFKMHSPLLRHGLGLHGLNAIIVFMRLEK